MYSTLFPTHSTKSTYLTIFIFCEEACFQYFLKREIFAWKKHFIKIILIKKLQESLWKYTQRKSLHWSNDMESVIENHLRDLGKINTWLVYNNIDCIWSRWSKIFLMWITAERNICWICDIKCRSFWSRNSV